MDRLELFVVRVTTNIFKVPFLCKITILGTVRDSEMKGACDLEKELSKYILSTYLGRQKWTWRYGRREMQGWGQRGFPLAEHPWFRVGL